MRGALGLDLPAWMATDVQTAWADPAISAGAPHIGSLPIAFNLPAAAVTSPPKKYANRDRFSR